jgi:hypothetical protein
LTSPAITYSEKAEDYARRRDDARGVSARISRLRLATFLPAAALLIWALSRGFTLPPIVIATALLVAFGVLVVWHARVEDRIAWLDALRIVNLRAVARIARDWSALPATEPPRRLDVLHHAYALDLDLFGRASLYQWLGPAATPRGAATLAAWLLVPAARDEIIIRQQTVMELAEADAWHEQFSAHGILSGAAGEAEITTFLQWVEGGDPLGPRAGMVRAAVFVITGAMWLLMLLNAIGIIAGAFWLVPLLAGVILSFAFAQQISSTFDRAGGGQHALRRYAALLEHAAKAPRSSTRLKELHERLSAGGHVAFQCMERLNRILSFADLRHSAGLFHFIIHAMTLWDFHVLFALERWRREVGSSVRVWLQALGELDALALLGAVRRDNPGWCTADIGFDPEINAIGMGHPLIPDDRRVANDVSVGPPGTILLVTGSNMSGKSTLLRAIGLNVVLGQAGAPACATSLRMPQLDLQTSIRVQDSLELGLSYFMAALARLKGVVDAAEHEREGRVLLYLLDEILQGTNSAERSIAVRAVARHLLDAGAVGAMTTHDLTLASEEPFGRAARLVHFTETVDPDGIMRFDYKLRPGLATSRNAIRLMQMIGIEP